MITYWPLCPVEGETSCEAECGRHLEGRGQGLEGGGGGREEVSCEGVATYVYSRVVCLDMLGVEEWKEVGCDVIMKLKLQVEMIRILVCNSIRFDILLP